MFLGHAGGEFVMNQSGPDSWKFIGHNGHPYPCAADKYTTLCLTKRNRLSYFLAKIWVVDGFRAIGSQITKSDLPFVEISLERFFEFKATVITCNDEHFRFSLRLLYFFKKQRRVSPAEPKGVGQGHFDVGLACFIGHVVEVALGIRLLIVDGRRHNPSFHGQ
ncbi:hypothetical protein AOP6_1599 [Desulfuromonas sp. AOP6]|nr:hypothetical protein AOP6_1599 [Desulfuromonas sp. AOP6]